MRLFDDFVPDELLGVDVERVDAALLAQWREVFPGFADGEAALPQGVLAALCMRAYMRILPQRPAGNVHARQRYVFLRAVYAGDELTTRLRCAGKELKHGRRWVYLHSVTVDQSAAVVCRGEMAMVWAA